MICCSTAKSSVLYENLSRGLLSNVHVRAGRGSASTLQVMDTCLPSVTLRPMELGDTRGAHAREERGSERIRRPERREGAELASWAREGREVCSSQSLGPATLSKLSHCQHSR